MSHPDYLLAQSDKRENGNVVTHADDEDEPQREREIFHIRQLDHLA